MNKRNIFNGFTIFVAIVCLLTFTLNMINGRFWLADFRVYYSAARSFFSGEQVYQISFVSGSGYYKYSPVILFFFLPICFLSFKIASVVYFFILGVGYWYAFTVIRKLLKKYFFTWDGKYEVLAVSLSFICILIYFTREMHLGNINIFMLLLCCQALWCYLEDKPASGSLFLGLVLLTKPFFLLLLLPLIWRKNWKAIAWLGFVLACGGMIPFLYPGITESLILYSGWFKAILAHDLTFPGMNSLGYIFRHGVFPALPDYAEYLIILAACGFATWFILANLKSERKEKDGDVQSEINFIFEWFLIISLLPVLFKTDWVQLLLSAPLITFMIFYLFNTKKYWLIPIMVFLLFFFGANSDDLLGKELSGKLFKMGLMGISDFLLVMLSLLMFLDFRKRKNRIHPERSQDKPKGQVINSGSGP